MSVKLISIRYFSERDDSCSMPTASFGLSSEHPTREGGPNVHNTTNEQNTRRFRDKFRALPWSYFVLSAIIIVVASAMSFSLLIFYASREEETLVTSDPSCSPNVYTGSVCQLELQDWQGCLPERQNESHVFISSDIDQELVEKQAVSLFMEMQQSSPNNTCQKEFRSFWCLLLFGICDGRDCDLPCHINGECYLTEGGGGGCRCKNGYEGDGETYCDDIDECERNETQCDRNAYCFNNNGSYSCYCRTGFTGDGYYCAGTGTIGDESSLNDTCSDQFFFEQSTQLCKPECGVWTQYSRTKATRIHNSLIAMEVLSAFICISVLLLSSLQYKRMFKFPSILIVYQTIQMFVMMIVDLIHFISLQDTVCSSKDLVKSLQPENDTGFCQFAGGLYLYSILFVTLLWLCHTSVFFWGVMYPIHYRMFTSAGKMKYLHAIVVPIIVVLPIISLILIGQSGGYGISIYGYYFCVGQNANSMLYGVVVPIITISIICTSLLIIIAWNILRNGLKMRRNTNEHRQLTADFKLIIVIVYYFLFTVHNIAVATNALQNSDPFQREVKLIFECEAVRGDCSMDSLDQFHDNAIHLVVSYIWLTLYPSIFFVFLINFGYFKSLLLHKRPNYQVHLNGTTRSSALKLSMSLQNINHISSKPASMTRSKSVDQLM